MGDAVSVAKAVEQGGIIFVLAIVCLGIGWLYIQERKKNDRLNCYIMSNNKDMITAILGVQNAIIGFKDALNSIRPYLGPSLSAPPPPPVPYFGSGQRGGPK